MRQLIFCGVLLAVVLVNASISISEDTIQETSPEKTAYAVRDFVLSYFHPVRGVVEEIKDGLARVSLTSDREFKKGVRLSVFREGSPFYHPVTKELMGKTEDLVGRIEIIQGEGDGRVYLCTIIWGDIKERDIVRITSSRIKLAFFQDRKSDWALSELLYNFLKDSQRFEILETYTKSYEPERLSELARGLNAEAVLMFSTPYKDGKRFLSVKLYWAEDARIFAETEEPLSSDYARLLIPEEEALFISRADRDPWGSYDLEGGELIAMGDVDGNGSKELVVSDGTNIRIYSLIEEPQELWFLKGSTQERHLSIDILDLNNNGRAEIFVTSLINRSNISTVDESKMGLIDRSGISSFVLEYDPLIGYRRIWDKSPYFLRVIGRTLLMQKFSHYGIFSNPVYEGEWKEGYYKPGKALKLPEGVNIYGFTFIDWQNNGDIQLVTFDDKGYLYLYKNGQLLWRSNKSYGNFDLAFEKDTYSKVNPLQKWYIRGRLLTLRTEHGQELIVVKKIPLSSYVPGLGASGAEVYSLWWDGDIMNEELILSKISGAITDYWIEGKELLLITRNNFFAFIKKAISGDLAKGSTLYYYNFTPFERGLR